jgi:cobaltochelatase CobN
VFRLPVRLHGHVALAIQPARGYNIDPKSTYHDAALCRRMAFSPSTSGCEVFGAHAVIHNGKTAISNGCPARRHQPDEGR